MRAAVDARSTLLAAASAANEAAAQALRVAEALDEALLILGRGADGPAAATRQTSSGIVDSLSPRQREVLALLAQGHSNRTIAQALFVSPNTVKTHVATLLNKLHADSRVQLATIAARHDVR